MIDIVTRSWFYFYLYAVLTRGKPSQIMVRMLLFCVSMNSTFIFVMINCKYFTSVAISKKIHDPVSIFSGPLSMTIHMALSQQPLDFCISDCLLIRSILLLSNSRAVHKTVNLKGILFISSYTFGEYHIFAFLTYHDNKSPT